MFTKVCEFGKDLSLPFVVIPLDEIRLWFALVGLNKATIFNVFKHFKVCQALYLLVVPHSIEETPRTVLDFHKGSCTVFVVLDAVKASNDLVEGSLNCRDVILVKGVVLNEVRSHLVSLGSLLFVAGTVVRVEGLADVLLCLNHLLGEKTRVFNLVEQLSGLLLDICRSLWLEALGFAEDLLGSLKGVEHEERFLLLGLTLKSLGAVLLPEFLHEFLWTFVLIYTNSRSNCRGTDDHFLDGEGFEHTLTLTNEVGVHLATRNWISEGVVGVVKLFAENVLVQVCKFDWTHKPLLVHLKSTTEYEIFNLGGIKTVA